MMPKGGFAAAARAAGAWNRRRHRRLSGQIGRLSDTALIVEDRLDPAEDSPGLPAPDRLRLRLRVFDLELAADRLAVAALRDLPPAVMRPALAAHLASLRDRLRAPPAALRAVTIGAPDASSPPETAPQAPGRRFTHALAALEAAIAHPPEPGASAAPSRDRETPPQEEQSRGADGPHDGVLRPTTRQAVQVTVACALAVVAGEILSPQRWYWAVLTAFVVFSGTQSRGETIVKAGQRVVGTVLGVAVGIGIADTVAHNTGLALLLIYLCVFLAYYLFPVAHGAMMFWISIVVALLYRLLGIFTPSLLLRIEETAIGAAIGVLVAAFLLPTRTSAQTAAALHDFLGRLGDTVEGAARHMAGEEGALDPAGVSRDLDRAFQTLRTAARPLASGLAGAVARTAVRRFLVVLRACGYYARDLARLSGQESTGENPELSGALIALAARIRRTGGGLADLIARGAPIAARRGILDRAEAVAAARYANDPCRQAAPDRQAAALYDTDHIEAAIRLLREGASRGRRRDGRAETAAL